MAASDALPVPKKGVAFRVYFPIFDADGDLVTGAAGLDSEISKDGGAMADCTNEATEIGSSGMYYLDLSSTEMNADAVVIIVKTSTSGAKTTPIVLYPEEAGDIRTDATHISGDSTAADKLEALMDGLLNNTAQAGANGTITLNSGATATDDYYNGFVILVTGGTGVGQARLITDYVGSTKVASVSPNWATNPDATSTFILFPMASLGLDTTALTNIKAMFDGTGYAGGTIRLKIDGAFRKNTALAGFTFMMIDSSDDISGKTGLTITAQRSIDGGAFASCANSASEISNGLYKIDLAAADLNGNVITLRFTASGANPTELTIVTTP